MRRYPKTQDAGQICRDTRTHTYVRTDLFRADPLEGGIGGCRGAARNGGGETYSHLMPLVLHGMFSHFAHIAFKIIMLKLL